METAPDCHSREEILHGLSSLAQVLPHSKSPPPAFYSISKNPDRQTNLPPLGTFNLSFLDPQDQKRGPKAILKINGEMSNPRPLEEVGCV
jgi:hypothetical protein